MVDTLMEVCDPVQQRIAKVQQLFTGQCFFSGIRFMSLLQRTPSALTFVHLLQVGSKPIQLAHWLRTFDATSGLLVD